MISRDKMITYLLAKLQVPPIDVYSLIRDGKLTVTDDDHVIHIKLMECDVPTLFKELGYIYDPLIGAAFITNNQMEKMDSAPVYLHVLGQCKRNPNSSISTVFNTNNGKTIYTRGESGYKDGMIERLLYPNKNSVDNKIIT